MAGEDRGDGAFPWSSSSGCLSDRGSTATARGRPGSSRRSSSSRGVRRFFCSHHVSVGTVCRADGVLDLGVAGMFTCSIPPSKRKTWFPFLAAPRQSPCSARAALWASLLRNEPGGRDLLALSLGAGSIHGPLWNDRRARLPLSRPRFVVDAKAAAHATAKPARGLAAPRPLLARGCRARRYYAWHGARRDDGVPYAVCDRTQDLRHSHVLHCVFDRRPRLSSPQHAVDANNWTAQDDCAGLVRQHDRAFPASVRAARVGFRAPRDRVRVRPCLALSGDCVAGCAVSRASIAGSGQR